MSALRNSLNNLPCFSGHVHLILGPMQSGKSTSLLREARRYELANRKVCLIKFAGDTRYSHSDVMTHDGFGRTADLQVADKEGLMKHVRNPVVAGADVVCVDEGQFHRDLRQFCEWAAELEKVVVVSALLGDAERNGWESVMNALPIADSVSFLTAICQRCRNRDAPFTWRHHEEQGDRGKRVQIGGAEKYQSVCGPCYRTLYSESVKSVLDLYGLSLA